VLVHILSLGAAEVGDRFYGLMETAKAFDKAVALKCWEDTVKTFSPEVRFFPASRLPPSSPIPIRDDPPYRNSL